MRHLRWVHKQGLEPSVRRDVEWYMGAVFQRTLFWRGIGDPGHVCCVGDSLDGWQGGEMGQLVHKGEHAAPATAHHTAMSGDMGIGREQLWEVLVHPLGDGAMLTGTQGGELATIPLGVLPHLLQTFAYALA